MTGEGTCTNCLVMIGSLFHRLHECSGVLQHLLWQRLAGRLQRRSTLFQDPLLLPLMLYGMPPLDSQWYPREKRPNVGSLGGRQVGTYYGDGSGLEQHSRAARSASWALLGPTDFLASSLQAAEKHSRTLDLSSYMSGSVAGWSPTVPRSEVHAILAFLEAAGPGSTYFGDCKYAIDVMEAGVPPYFRSSRCKDADLWRRARRLMDELPVRPGMTYIKVKAHRSRTEAECNGPEDVRAWSGNAVVDCIARSTAKLHAARLDSVPPHRIPPDEAHEALAQLAAATAWSLRHWPEIGARRGTRPRRARRGCDAGPHNLVPRQGGGWQCSKCRLYTRTPSSLKTLRIRPCLSLVTQQCHHSHDLRWQQGVLWCGNCARYAVRMPRALKDECPGRPMSEAARNVKRRLMEGLPPTTARYLREEAVAEARAPDIFINVFPADSMATDSGGSDLPSAAAAAAHRPGRYARLDASRARETAQSSTSGTCGPHEPVSENPARIIGDDNDVGSSSLAGSSAEGFSASTACTDSTRTLARRRSFSTPAAASGFSCVTSSAHVPRRIRGKQRPPETAAPTGPGFVSASSQAPSALCRPSATASWSQRLALPHGASFGSCSVCASRSRTHCRGCLMPLCIRCARDKVWCKLLQSEAP